MNPVEFLVNKEHQRFAVTFKSVSQAWMKAWLWGLSKAGRWQFVISERPPTPRSSEGTGAAPASTGVVLSKAAMDLLRQLQHQTRRAGGSVVQTQGEGADPDGSQVTGISKPPA